jgi:hypothetical protein
MLDNCWVQGLVELDSDPVHGDPANCAGPAFHVTYLQRKPNSWCEWIDFDDQAATVGR